MKWRTMRKIERKWRGGGGGGGRVGERVGEITRKRR